MACYAQQFPDVFQAGCIGLNRAVDGFDISRGNDIKFISYAVWWIQQSIKLHLNSDNLIHIPMQKVTENNKYRRVNKAKIAKGELPPNIDGIPTLTRIDVNTGQSDDSDVEQNILVTRATTQTVPDAERLISEQQLRKVIDQLVGELDARSGHVLYALFGIDGNECTLQEVADEFGLTRERIRQIRINAIKKLKKTIQVRRLDSIIKDLITETQDAKA